MNSFKRVPQLFEKRLTYSQPRRAFATTLNESIWEKNKNFLIGAGVLGAIGIYYYSTKPKQPASGENRSERSQK